MLVAARAATNRRENGTCLKTHTIKCARVSFKSSSPRVAIVVSRSYKVWKMLRRNEDGGMEWHVPLPFAVHAAKYRYLVESGTEGLS